MKFIYHVPGKDINAYNNDGIIKLSNEEILGSLAYTPEKAKEDDGYTVFDTLEEARRFALVDQEQHKQDVFPIMVLAAQDDLELGEKVTIDKDGDLVVDGKVEKSVKKGKRNVRTTVSLGEDDPTFSSYQINAKEVVIVSASMKHSSDKFEDHVFDKANYDEFVKSEAYTKYLASMPKVAADEPANTSTDANTPTDNTAAKFNVIDFAKRWLLPAGVVAGVGVGFATSGASLTAVGLIGKSFGVALPVVGGAGIALQVAVSALVGAAAYGTFLAAQVVVGAVWNAGKSAYAEYKKTQKQKYEDNKVAATKDVEALEAELKYDANSDMHKTLADLLNSAPEAEFDASEKLVVNPATEANAAPVLNRLQVLEQERQALKEIQAANDNKRQELEAKILTKGFKFS